MTAAKGNFSFDTKITVRGSLPRTPFRDIARTVLGDQYELSLVICGDKLSHRMNQTYRDKDYTPNVLSFPLSKQSGEIFLNVRKAEREAKQMSISTRARLAHLYVHGCFHLAGYEHSDDMERREDRILARFKLV